MPNISADIAIWALSKTSSSRAVPLFSSPKTLSIETLTSLRVIFAEFRESTILVLFTPTPSRSGSTKNKVIPDESFSEPLVLAATIRRFELCPSITKVLFPVRV